MKLKELTEKVSYIKNPVNIGVIKSNNGVILIDTGLDDDTGKKILKVLDKAGMNPVAIINTHSHADHCGGNSYIKKNKGVKVYAPEVEAEIIGNPYFEPFFLFSGADPIKDLKNKFLMAKPTKVDEIIDREKEILTVDGVELRIASLPGHFINQIGILVDDVLFCADSVFSEKILNKHKIPFHVDINKQKETLEKLKKIKCKYYIPAHGELTDDITNLVDVNMKAINSIEETLLKLLSSKKTTDELLNGIFNYLRLKLKTSQQYYLMRTSIMAYLSHLYNHKKIEMKIENNIVYWKRA
ncbi:MBL fold metallo-hydrolase [Thermohalobacter berrensis]|uniref:beta-lactamase n=1 Tax=Thermohalobacter berrensis TaxID=99594 RepID=A0A419SXM5_9FIRM|nr:MBL fold metallo-hydrolase [Thermohalobacter berrensis]RKD30023.1 MBL fold metallo-hydrolase [Thermohalobacter berrensis]